MTEIAQQQITALEEKVGSDAKSPFFAQLANFYLELHRAEDALRMCDAGLAHYPFYTTGHLVKGKALVALHMRAEARREFEFVLEFLPRNEMVTTLLEQIPPSEDETITAALQEVQPEVSEPEYIPPSLDEYKIPSTPQLHPEPGYSFSGFDQPAQEQQPELSPAPTSLSGPSFFDAITQAPAATTTDDLLGFAAPSIETPEMPEPSSVSGFDVPMPESPSFSETQASTFADIPRSAPEPSSGFEFTLSAPDQESLAPALSEEEPFTLYASRRRAELTGEDTISLEDYLSNAAIVLPEGLTLELPMSTSIQNKIDDTITREEYPTDTTIILPQIPPPELPMSASIQNQIEEIANKLQSAGKITPVIDLAQKETPTASEQDLPVSMGFVTPTLAEIYAKQGWFDDAIKAYKVLARNKPGEKARFEKRIEELEKLKNQSGK
jgi:tetratricopeptide (TPR) repeat protein